MAKVVRRQRKHKVLAREKTKENVIHEAQDTNQEIILSTEKKELDERKALMKSGLCQTDRKISGKKAKRLEKYIDNKLRKDENRELLAKLAARKIDTSLFASSKSLGQGRETKKQAISRALREKRAGIEVEETDALLFEKRRGLLPDDKIDNNENENAGDFGSKEFHTFSGTNPHDALPSTSATVRPIDGFLGAAGSGLKRPLDLDENGRPIIKKRQKRGGVKAKAQQVIARTTIKPQFEEWNGLSSDSETDGIPHGHELDEGQSSSEDIDEVDSQGSSTSAAGEKTSYDYLQDDGEEEEAETQRSSAFKAWAHKQHNKALGYQPVDIPMTMVETSRPRNFVPRAPEQDPLPMELKPTTRMERNAFSVIVDRKPEVQEARLRLPIVAEEQRLMEAIHNYETVVICGSTGSGKTTQVPQFLFEAGYGSAGSPTPGMIGITQPRRVAAVSMSRRVAEELGDHAWAVAYQIRFEGTVDSKTAVKFMTDGVLLREMTQDISLRKYSAIIIDEAHERSVNTDILVGMLSRVVKLRAELSLEESTLKPLKLIIMSATIRIEDLTMNPTLFPTPPPVLTVEGRQHSVMIHFSRRTQSDYVEEAFRKISRGHRKLPPGGFLVFLTGRNEIMQLSKRLKTAFGGPKFPEGPKVQILANDGPIEVEDIEFGDMDDREVGDVGDDLLGDDSEDEEEQKQKEFQIEQDQEAGPLKMYILPLYSLLPTREQMKIFEPPPEGSRLIILATNVAETSLTIPDIRFVFDCGRSKERNYDRLSGVQSYNIGWISKASADQRSGRAGRTAAGHCYRLYSSAVYERDFQPFSDPELMRTPIEGIVLQLKAMNLQNVVNFPFPTPPERESLAKAERLLKYLTALSPDGRITEVGRTMAVFPLSPRFARILLVGHLYNCLPYTIALVAGLSAGEIFLPENRVVPELQGKENSIIRTNTDVMAENCQANARRRFNEVHRNFCFLDDRSDAMKLLQVVGEFAHEPTEQWCDNHFVRLKVLKEITQLRRQITELLRINMTCFSGLQFQDKLDPPSPKQVSALKQMLAAGFVDQVAIRADLAPFPPEHRKPRRAIDVPYVPLMPLGAGPGHDKETKGLVYIHPSSTMAHLSPQECPEYVVYAYLQRHSADADGKHPKIRMHALTDISGAQLSGLAKCTPLISYGKPIKEVETAAPGADGALVRRCWVVPFLCAEGSGAQGWPLPAKKVTQRRVPGKGWVVE